VGKKSTAGDYWAGRLEAEGSEETGTPQVETLQDIEKEYPRLTSFLRGGSVDGKWIEGGTMLISVSPDGAKIGLHDRHHDKWAWSTKFGFDELLKAAEVLAGQDPKLWRAKKRQWKSG